MSVLISYATGMLGVVLLALAWIGVQAIWRRSFPELSHDPDVLAGRPDCHGCTGAGQRESCGARSNRRHEHRKEKTFEPFPRPVRPRR